MRLRIRWLSYARDKALFGDLANNADFLALMREKVAAVYTLIK
jgi:D-arabinitol 4-dehydrogenase